MEYLLHGDLLCADLRLFCEANRTTQHSTWQSTEKMLCQLRTILFRVLVTLDCGQDEIYKFINISLCGHISSVELHKYCFGSSEHKGTERGGKTHKYLRKCLPCSYSKGIIFFLTCICPNLSKSMQSDKFIVYLPAYFLFFEGFSSSVGST